VPTLEFARYSHVSIKLLDPIVSSFESFEYAIARKSLRFIGESSGVLCNSATARQVSLSVIGLCYLQQPLILGVCHQTRIRADPKRFLQDIVPYIHQRIQRIVFCFITGALRCFCTNLIPNDFYNLNAG